MGALDVILSGLSWEEVAGDSGVRDEARSGSAGRRERRRSGAPPLAFLWIEGHYEGQIGTRIRELATSFASVSAFSPRRLE
ncbi:hypothetical protein Poly30_41760 [Planctomycetes bacterium Poly30]|uniref:Uncharacterized protein n=1 Tax=Saltatorellus ferox TaxID=2528018 RepID=A0A518EX05_9BACT|nr:hypothetical protein Poly30_41760 [Planctomycetes bacterium Poly30]